MECVTEFVLRDDLLMRTPVTSRRLSLRFGLRTIVVVVTLVGCLFAWVAKERRQSAFEGQLAKELDEQDYSLIIAGPYDSIIDMQREPSPQGRWRDLMRFVLGDRIRGISWYSIDLQGQDRIKLPAGISHLSSCEITSVTLQDLRPIAELSNLDELAICAPNVSDLSPIAGLADLKRLYIDRTSVSDLAPLAGLSNLQRLTLFMNRQVNDLRPLAELSNLRELSIAGPRDNPIRDLRPLAKLSNLRYLDIGLTSASDLTPLAELSNLEFLSLSAPSISDEQVKALQEALPGCKISVN